MVIPRIKYRSILKGELNHASKIFKSTIHTGKLKQIATNALYRNLLQQAFEVFEFLNDKGIKLTQQQAITAIANYDNIETERITKFIQKAYQHNKDLQNLYFALAQKSAFANTTKWFELAVKDIANESFSIQAAATIASKSVKFGNEQAKTYAKQQIEELKE